MFEENREGNIEGRVTDKTPIKQLKTGQWGFGIKLSETGDQWFNFFEKDEKILRQIYSAIFEGKTYALTLEKSGNYIIVKDVNDGKPGPEKTHEMEDEGVPFKGADQLDEMDEAITNMVLSFDKTWEQLKQTKVFSEITDENQRIMMLCHLHNNIRRRF